MINLKWDNSLIGDESSIISKYGSQLEKIRKDLLEKKTLGSDFLEWLDWPTKKFYETDYKIMSSIQEEWMKKKIDTIVVTGIGGSYIGPKAGIEMLIDPFTKTNINIIFVGGIHTNYNHSLLEGLTNKNWALITISKSGTTFETSINFRIFREKLFTMYGQNHNQRIVAITDSEKGILKSLADRNNYQTLIIPNGIGGRYSSLTAVGLFPLLLAGVNIDELLKGWVDTINAFKNNPINHNSAMIYAAIRFSLLTEQNKVVEVFNTYDRNLCAIAEHYKQIFAESEGKTTNCLIPTIANNSEDLHSIGQLYQDGNQAFFETTLTIKKINKEILIPKSSFLNDDKLDHLAGKSLKKLNHLIELAVKKAHDKIPNITIELENCEPYDYGSIMAWLAIAAATGSLLLKVNPFDQPGVEAYKSEMKKLIK